MTKTALITGASRGIGKALSHYFANQGYNLVLIAKQEANLNRVFDDLKDQYPHLSIKTHHLDFAQPEIAVKSFEAIINQLKTIDVLVNSAGVLKAGHIDLTFEQLSELINVNLLSTIAVCNAVAAKMKHQGFGAIYNLGSTAGLSPVPKIAAYSATKSALVSYSQSLYQELLPHNVQVCCLCPSVVDTDMTNDGRIKNELKIQPQDLSKAIDFARSLSTGAAMSVLPIRCKVIDLENS
ncbi:SDR family NAD(P)-dependent oxidoreductase [Vibrio neptunius]|uniref:SDR family NAD(P)-dependent oxidoreductase n=1 Tax=Vibrio neptunius TaxID=170651 RepID=UPI0019D05066|nr:SDR family NAD(P)-dependent oxidoreductase [Vibrio neptunius]MBN3573187.1 SDR family NAD(P)-dependent oxidoreductase [Vibrio neptunius]QXX08309.1 SDR family NAD(P)-dependent oxidoreductase [Vibrio neptunius]